MQERVPVPREGREAVGCLHEAVEYGCWGLTEQKIHLSRHRSSVRTRPTSEIYFRTDLQNLNFCAMGRNSRFTGDFELQKFLAKVRSFATTFAMAGSET
jgi:hypothetical protein